MTNQKKHNNDLGISIYFHDTSLHRVADSKRLADSLRKLYERSRAVDVLDFIDEIENTTFRYVDDSRFPKIDRNIPHFIRNSISGIYIFDDEIDENGKFITKSKDENLRKSHDEIKLVRDDSLKGIDFSKVLRYLAEKDIPILKTMISMNQSEIASLMRLVDNSMKYEELEKKDDEDR